MPLADTRPPLCIALHDVSPATWPACAPLLSLVDGIGDIPVTLLVVPDYHWRGRIDRHRPFLRAIERRLARGDEVALHGYYHLDDQATPLAPADWLRRRLYTAGEGEFAALREEDATARLEQGLNLLQGLGWPVHGFVAPAWLLSAGARAALSRSHFSYTTSLRAIYRLPDWHAQPSPALTYSVRGAWRRVLSRGWNEYLFSRVAWHPGPVRFGLHPADAHHPAVVRHWQNLIVRALPLRRAMTKHTCMESSACVAAAFG